MAKAKPAKTAKKPAKSKGKKKPALWRRLLRWTGMTIVGVCVFLLLFVGMFRFVNPPINYYQAAEWVRHGEFRRDWVPLERMSRHLPLSAAAAEDAKFCDHYGFDFDAIQEALEGGARRGASTISQQVSKNVFLWQGRSWVRKGLEAGFTVLIEGLWGKRRIMEVYLNVAEFDTGVFGVEAAAQHYFGMAAADLGPQRSSALMAVLPNPKDRSASQPTAGLQRRARSIAAGARTLEAEGRAACFRFG
ncbi:monofunctional biosynthetic peptidoglycan transglycosylase [Algicella marina]|uniref:Biosynthetic peptidoglycan transglycosylase n=1 Tax=Algicella marina TaxID=2683284 RepID=A0A6P1T1B1_9RHOB|nr:monofunctional biosynthetic peptidoglycan transglycosylase [Algicella marina]QHQ36528.1 monofunctional biosynthetic peptidoglycan transglycosylase [Algicella marina]